MLLGQKKPFSGQVSFFHDRRLPKRAIPVGYASLIDAFELAVHVPINLAAIGSRHKVYQADDWKLYTPRHQPDASLTGHLTFALRYEGLDLAVLKALFQATGPRPLIDIVHAAPTGAYALRLWFLYEWLLDTRLDLDDATRGTYALIVDPDLQWAIDGTTSSPHTQARSFYRPRSRRLIAEVPADLLARTAAFLLLKDSRSSFQIEGEDPPRDRIQRGGQVIAEAGRHPIDRAELERLQRLVIGDARFVYLGLRADSGFVGEHDRLSGAPIPDHVSARHDDLPTLIEGLTAFDRGAARQLDPVLAGATLAFGFVYIHPFEDGNGRLHRYVIHHVLAERGFNPPGVVFPVSAVILDRIDEYRQVLETYSRRLLPFVRWRPTERGNVEVLNETVDFYRYFDATPHAEFLFEYVARTIDVDLPAETAFLKTYDSFKNEVSRMIDMPDRLLDLLFRFLSQNGGKVSKRARETELAGLTEKEAARIELMYTELLQS
jgi:hypothetical protein